MSTTRPSAMSFSPWKKDAGIPPRVATRPVGADLPRGVEPEAFRRNRDLLAVNEGMIGQFNPAPSRCQVY